MNNKSSRKIALDLYTSNRQRPDQAIQEISITIARGSLGKPSLQIKPVLILLEFCHFLAHFSLTTKCKIINAKWFQHKPSEDYFYCVF